MVNIFGQLFERRPIVRPCCKGNLSTWKWVACLWLTLPSPGTPLQEAERETVTTRGVSVEHYVLLKRYYADMFRFKLLFVGYELNWEWSLFYHRKWYRFAKKHQRALWSKCGKRPPTCLQYDFRVEKYTTHHLHVAPFGILNLVADLSAAYFVMPFPLSKR